MEKDILPELIRDSLIYSEKQNLYCQKYYKLGQFSRMDYEQETGKMIFSDAGVIPRVIADFQIIGSLSAQSDTWLWAWDNPYLLENTAMAVLEVKRFGERNRIPKLTQPKWHAGAKDAREMNALAAYILKARGTYEFPSDDIRVYTVFTEIRWIGMAEHGDEP
jgi:hypothetical protein